MGNISLTLSSALLKALTQALSVIVFITSSVLAPPMASMPPSTVPPI